MGLFEKDRPALQVDYHEKAPPPQPQSCVIVGSATRGKSV